jgi:uncharacterized protein YkwD
MDGAAAVAAAGGLRHGKAPRTRAGRTQPGQVSLVGRGYERAQDVSRLPGNMVTVDQVAAAEGANLGHECVRLTNVFRSQHGLPPVEWHGVLAALSFEHSRAMGLHKVPFDHVGFNARVRRYTFRVRGAAENLFMAGGARVEALAQLCVQGWIESPGHRKNLLCKATWCGIGVFRNRQGQVYITQLFGLQ